MPKLCALPAGCFLTLSLMKCVSSDCDQQNVVYLCGKSLHAHRPICPIHVRQVNVAGLVFFTVHNLIACARIYNQEQCPLVCSTLRSL